jgi:hypothetical protein
MITPSFGLTATERVLPRMALDFTTASLDSRVTFTRAGNTATCVNSSGNIALVNADLPRFDYDPTTLVCNGLLIEESRTNLILYSEQFDNVAWVKTTGTITANATTSPDGTANADLITTSGVSAQLSAGTTIGLGATISGSVYLKPAGMTAVEIVLLSNNNTTPYGRATFNISNGTISVAASTANGGTNASAQITPAGNGWYRCSVTVTYPATVLAGIRINAAGATGGYYLWGAQFETGAFATSYIPTVASTVTRTADVATMTGTNFSSWYNQTQGAFYAEGSSASTSRVLLSADDGTMNNRYQVQLAGSYTPNFAAISGGGASADLYTSAGTIGNTVKIVGTYKLDSYAVASNGSNVSVDSSGALPISVNTMRIGVFQNTTGFLCGYVRKIMFYPQRLINAEVSAFSK